MNMLIIFLVKSSSKLPRITHYSRNIINVMDNYTSMNLIMLMYSDVKVIWEGIPLLMLNIIVELLNRVKFLYVNVTRVRQRHET